MIQVTNAVRTQLSRNLSNALLKAAIWSVPYDTGNLASSVRTSISTNSHIQISIGGPSAEYALAVDRRGRSSGYTEEIAAQFIPIIVNYFLRGGSSEGFGFSWSKTFYEVTQAKGVGTLGSSGTRYLIGRSRRHGETRNQRRNRSLRKSKVGSMWSHRISGR